MAQYNSTSITSMSEVQQKMLCALAYLGKYYHTQLQIEKLLSWIGSDTKQYNDITNELQSKAWLVEDVAYLEGCPILLVNPIRLSEILDFLLTSHPEWKSELESLVPHFSSFRNFEDLLMEFFNADIIDSCNILPRVCQSLTEKLGTAREMLSLFRYYSHGEFSPIERGTTAYTFILYGLRYQHQGDNKKAASMWAHALKLNHLKESSSTSRRPKSRSWTLMRFFPLSCTSFK